MLRDQQNELSGEGPHRNAAYGHIAVADTGQPELQGEGHFVRAKKGRDSTAAALHTNRSEEGLRPCANGLTSAADLASTIDTLAEHTVQLVGLIRAKNRILLQAKAIVRRALDWQAGDEEGARKGVNERASRIVDAFLKGNKPDDDDAELTAALAGQLAVWQAMIQPAEKAIKETEKAMELLVASLPGYEFQKTVRGFGAKAFALIIGLAGDLSQYPKKGHLWKRLGLSPFEKDGVVKACSTWRREGGLSKEDWADREHGPKYSPERRSILFAYLEDPLIKGNGDGPYRAHYLKRKLDERVKAEAAGLTVVPAAKIPRGRNDEFISEGHIERRARRAMAQMLVRDLWQEWRQAIVSIPS